MRPGHSAGMTLSRHSKCLKPVSQSPTTATAELQHGKQAMIKVLLAAAGFLCQHSSAERVLLISFVWQFLVTATFLSETDSIIHA